jgi:DNA-binding LacI/PurR family transcriptional regulator
MPAKSSKETLTIHDVARIANVSASTVSRVMRGREGVGEETRKRILALIGELQYHPNIFAQNLSGNRNYTIGFAYSQRTSDLLVYPVFSTMIGIIGDTLTEAGFSLSLHTATSGVDAKRLLQAAMRRQVEGILVTDLRKDDNIVEQLNTQGVPCVVIGRRYTEPNIVWVDTDHEEGIRQLTNILIRAGHTMIAFINGPEDSPVSDLREVGFRMALEEAGIPLQPGLLRSGAFSAENGYRHLSEFLALPRAQQPTAVVASSDLIAAGCIQAANEQGVRIPDDIALTGYDDDPLASFTHPTLTTVRMPIREMAYAGAKMLLAVVNGEASAPLPLILPGQTIIRNSSGSPRRD